MPFRTVHPLASFLARAGLGSALVLAANQPLAYAGAGGMVIGPAETARTVAVDISEMPDFDASLARQLSIEAAKQAEEFGFDPSQITITIVWLDAASSSYGIHVYIETKDAKLPDGPRGPMLNRCEECSQRRVPETALEALMRGFELYEDALKQQRKGNAPVLNPGPDGQPSPTVQPNVGKPQEDVARSLKRQRVAAAVLLSVGAAAHVAGITLMVLWKDGHSQGLYLEGREYYIPGTVLLSLSPAPIAAGAVYLAGYVKAKKKQRVKPSVVGLRRGLGLGATIRF